MGVHDRHVGNSFDLLATRGDERLYVEVKGTSTSGEQVILTKNEVAHARANKAVMVLSRG